MASPPTLVFGCQVLAPNVFQGYIVRTCDADGYSGWMSLVMGYTISNAPTNPIQFTTDDIMLNIPTTLLAGPNVINVVPEPSTWAMMAFGLAAAAPLVARRRSSQSIARSIE